MKDIVFPNNNEKEFLEIAGKLGTELIFVYDYNPKIKEGVLVNKKNIMKAKDNLFVKAEEDNRFYFDDKRKKTIFDLELSQRMDFMHHRNSGLNQVLCKLANKNSITIGFSFSSILYSTGAKRAIILGRMKQNLRLCKKYKVKILFASFASKPEDLRNLNDIKAFFESIS